MTILHDECRPTHSTPSDAVVELMAEAVCWAGFQMPEQRTDTPGEYWDSITEEAREHYRSVASAALSALSDAGLAVRPIEPTAEMVQAMEDHFDIHSATGEFADPWAAADAAFHPSQLEKTDE